MSFDLETILGFLFVIFFVILPIFSKRRKGPQPGQPGQPGGPPTAQGPDASGTPRPGGERGVPTASTTPSAPTRPVPQQAPAASLQATLDEIRQRVYEAQQQEKASSKTSRSPAAGRPIPDAMASASSTGTKLGGQHSSSSADPFGQGMVSGQYSAHGSLSSAGTAQSTSSRTQRQSAGSRNVRLGWCLVGNRFLGDESQSQARLN